MVGFCGIPAVHRGAAVTLGSPGGVSGSPGSVLVYDGGKLGARVRGAEGEEARRGALCRPQERTRDLTPHRDSVERREAREELGTGVTQDVWLGHGPLLHARLRAPPTTLLLSHVREFRLGDREACRSARCQQRGEDWGSALSASPPVAKEIGAERLPQARGSPTPQVLLPQARGPAWLGAPPPREVRSPRIALR